MLSGIQIFLINAAIFFGHYVIISAALNFQFGNAGVPNMSSNISVAVGAYTVSSLIIRICMWIGSMAGLVFGQDWVYDNPSNVSMINQFFETQPLFSFSIFLSSLGLAFMIGSALGWILGALSGKLRATKLMMFLLIISDTGGVIVANNEFIAGGTLGAFIPNFFSWYDGEYMVIIATTILAVGLSCYLITRTMMNSPFGRLMRAVRDNEVTLMSTGKDISVIRRQVMMFGSGMMAVSGVLIAYYYNFVQYPIYSRVSYTFWPWLMITVGGLGNHAGSYFGTLIVASVLKGLGLARQGITPQFFGSRWIGLLTYFERIILSILLLLSMIFRPRGIVPEKNLRIPGINYSGIVLEKEKTRSPSAS